MRAMASSCAHITKAKGHNKMVEYFDSMSATTNFPRIVERETLRKIIEDGKTYYPSSWRNGIFYDAWGEPIIITLTTNNHGELGFYMHSFGKNKRNDNGKKDDIIMWFNNALEP